MTGLRGDEIGPYAIRLQPWGTITGRLVDAAGAPRKMVMIWPKDGRDSSAGLFNVQTDGDGRFRLEREIPGLNYSETLVGVQPGERGFPFEHVVLKAGESRTSAMSKRGPTGEWSGAGLTRIGYFARLVGVCRRARPPARRGR